MRRWVQGAVLGWSAITAAYFVAFKAGALSARAELFAGMVLALLVLLAIDLGLALASLRRRRDLAAAGTVLLEAGVIAALLGGAANWALGVRGYALLTPGERVQLSRVARLGALETGPLFDASELAGTLELVELSLVRGPAGDLAPRSRVRLTTAAGAARELTLSGGAGEPHGALRLYNGAFGFAPRLVVLQGEATLLDRRVFFSSYRAAEDETQFAGELTLAEHGLELRGRVHLDSLDAELRGHPTLELEVARDGAAVGSGRLQLGHFAELGGGLRVGFAGLTKWAEIDVGRRGYPGVVLAGAATAAGGALLRLAGGARRRR